MPKTYTLDLHPAVSEQYGAHFSGQIDDAEVAQYVYALGTGLQTPLIAGSTGYPGTFVFDQALALVRDDAWETDPINGSHDFRLRIGLADP
jgi:hypothetical protein